MDTSEIVLNLWYVRDEEGIIYSLRVRPYVAKGTDEEKLAFLQERALLDYLIADPFSVPERFHLYVDSGGSAARTPVGHVSMLQTLDSPIALFEDALNAIESRFPAQTKLSIPKDPLSCTTPLMQDEQGLIVPRIEGRYRY